MLKFNLIKRSFVRQSGPDDCGLACLAMLLNYNGRPADARRLTSALSAPEGGLSLLDLKNIAQTAGLAGNCVKMNIDILKTLKTPVILHMVNEAGQNHFQVCYEYNSRRGQFLMADPAMQVYYLNENELESQWQSKTALYFEVLDGKLESFKMPTIKSLLISDFFPRGLWLTIPAITLFITCLGLSLTWLIQRILNHSFVNKNDKLVLTISALLLIIGLFKSILSFIRQLILIRINQAISKRLMDAYAQKPYSTKMLFDQSIKYALKNDLYDINKIQEGLLVLLAATVSDATLIFLSLSISFYYSTTAGLCNLMFLAVSFLLTFYKLREHEYHNARIRNLAASTESQLLAIKAQAYSEGTSDKDERLTCYQTSIGNQFKLAKKLALDNIKSSLIIEITGTIALIIVFTNGLIQLNENVIDYGSFTLNVLFSFLITTLLPRLLSSFSVLSDAAGAFVQHYGGAEIT